MTALVETHPLISIRSSAKLREAARLMADCSIAALGVLGTDRHFIGLITERDLSWCVAQAKDAKETAVAEIVNDFPVVVEGPIDEQAALEQMRSAHIRHLIVREGDEFRMVSMRDVALTPRAWTATGPLAGDVMTAPAIACREDAFFEEVAELLADRDISGMPVVDPAGRVVGVISERDLAHALGGPMVRLAVRRHSHAPSPPDIRQVPREARRAKDVMTSPPVTVTREARVDAIARLMRVNQINRVLVVENDHQLIGVVSRGDILAAIANLEHAPIDLTRPTVLVGGAGLHQEQATLSREPTKHGKSPVH